MNTQRKMAISVKKLSLKEAELAEDKYWSEKSPVFRLKALMEMRAVTYASCKQKSIEKVVYKRELKTKQ